MIGLLLMAQAMVETLDTRPQPAIPATAFRCNFARTAPDGTQGGQFDLYGTIPLAPRGHQPNDDFPLVLGSAAGDSLAGPAEASPDHASDWFRDYQISRRVGTASYFINLKLRREGNSVAYITVYDGSWNAGRDDQSSEPFRYDAVGMCEADFSPKEQGS